MEQRNRNWNEWNGSDIIYALYAGVIITSDGDEHHISCPALKGSYGLHIKHTVFIPNRLPDRIICDKLDWLENKPVVRLFPVANGEYKETLEKETELQLKKWRESDGRRKHNKK